MGQADRIMCEKCMAVNDANNDVCRRCGEPLPQQAAMSLPNEPHSPYYGSSPEFHESPRNALDELMQLDVGQLIGFGIRLGFVLAIAEIIALIVITIIVVVLVIFLTLLGFSVGNLFFGNATTLTGF